MMNKIVKIFTQIVIICGIYFVGNLISRLLSGLIIIPGNIIGMVLLFILLITNTIKLPMIEETGNFILRYMGFFLVPFTVGLMESYKIIKGSIVQIMIILVISLIIVLSLSSKVTDLLIQYKEKKND